MVGTAVGFRTRTLPRTRTLQCTPLIPTAEPRIHGVGSPGLFVKARRKAPPRAHEKSRARPGPLTLHESMNDFSCFDRLG
jgi:hypothetical protein